MKIAIGFGAGGRSNDWERNLEFVLEAEKLGVEHAGPPKPGASMRPPRLPSSVKRTSKMKVGTAIMQLSRAHPGNDWR